MRSSAFLRATLGLVVLVQALVQARGQQAAQSSTQSQTRPVIVIGCLERVGNAYVLKDLRDGTQFQIDAPAQVVAPAESLDWHVGHKLEIHGTLESTASQGMMRLRATAIIYVSRTCPMPVK
jgi:hypothetical protein